VDIKALLALARENGASDLHMVLSCPPLLRIDGALQPVGDTPLTREDIDEGLVRVTTPAQRDQFSAQMELDFAYFLPDVGRLRCNACRQQGSTSLACRLLAPTTPTIDDLGLPPMLKDLSRRQRGLVVVSGPTGSGKSTTLAAMLNHINLTQQRYIVSIEDPIEYVHYNNRSAVSQRELGVDTLSFPQALKHILRQDPDVILVGEMRDMETAHAVLTVAETGHLVMSTGHAPSSAGAIDRIVDLFPPHERPQAAARLASVLAAVLCQVLVPRINGGRAAAVEIMLGVPAVKNLIREGKTFQLPNLIRTNNREGMKTLDQALVELYFKEIIEWEAVRNCCHDIDEVEKLVGEIRVR